MTHTEYPPETRFNWLPSAPACQHCYCQRGPLIGDVPHVMCCKCSERMAVQPWLSRWAVPEGDY